MLGAGDSKVRGMHPWCTSGLQTYTRHGPLGSLLKHSFKLVIARMSSAFLQRPRETPHSTGIPGPQPRSGEVAEPCSRVASRAVSVSQGCCHKAPTLKTAEMSRLSSGDCESQIEGWAGPRSDSSREAFL